MLNISEILKLLEEIKKRSKSLTLFIPQISQENREGLHEEALDLLLKIIELETLFLREVLLDKNKEDKSVRTYNPPIDHDDERRKEINKIHRKIPKWANNLNQINSKILRLYLTLKMKSETPITETALKESYGNVSEFQRNYPQMKIISPKNHCKVFDVKNGIVEIWEPAKGIINQYKQYFMSDSESLDINTSESTNKGYVMTGNPYTKEEIILCTYIARFGRTAFDERGISRLKNRSVNSIKMKVQNIAAMLNEEGYEYSNEVNLLSGLPAGMRGRRTNWDIVSNLADLNKEKLRNRCLDILSER